MSADHGEMMSCHCGMVVPRALWLKHNAGHVLGLDGRADGYTGRGIWTSDAVEVQPILAEINRKESSRER